MLNRHLNLSFKEEYNSSLRHFKLVGACLQALNSGQNIADFLNEEGEGLDEDQKLGICNVLLLEKLGYGNVSLNLNKDFENPRELFEVFSSWGGVDLTLLYFHNNLGLILLGNKTVDDWSLVENFRFGEYVSCFFKAKAGLENKFDQEEIKNDICLVLQGEKLRDVNKYESSSQQESAHFESAPKPSVQAPVQSSQEQPVESSEVSDKSVKKKPVRNLKMTPKYSCQVTNELFHNGNVEAWKNIIESYHSNHKGCKVIVYHNGELINNINTLFKWGKVKNGDVIMFCVVGESFKNISKLQKYLFEGASNRFQKFLKTDLNKILELF